MQTTDHAAGLHASPASVAHQLIPRTRHTGIFGDSTALRYRRRMLEMTLVANAVRRYFSLRVAAR